MRTILTFVGMIALGAARVFAAAGDLDPAFGTGGFQEIPIGLDAYPHALARQPDGRLVVAGETGYPTSDNLAVTRSLATGPLDATFAAGGVRVETSPPDPLEGRAALIQSSGRIVVAGRKLASVVLYGYLPSGSPDPAFGTGGVTVTPISPTGGFTITAALQVDDKIVVAGDTTNALTSGVPYVARYDADGALDAGFGSGGVTMLDFPGDDDQVASVGIEPGGGIVIGGYAATGSSNAGYVARVDAAGVVDGGYGPGGVAPLGLATSHIVQRVLPLPDGRLVVGGFIGPDGFLVRLDPGGAVDPTFGTAGLRIVDYGGIASGVGSLGLDPLGRIVAAGFHIDLAGRTAFGVARYSIDGVPDPSFGSDGSARVALSAHDMSDTDGMAFEADGTITLAGGSFLVNSLEGSRTQFTLARIQASGPTCASDDDCPLCQSCTDGVCTHAPRSSCAPPDAGRQRIKWRVDLSRPRRNRLAYRWRGTRAPGTFDPIAGDEAAVCFYVGAAPAHRSLTEIVPGGPCVPGSCWRRRPGGFRYGDQVGTALRLTRDMVKFRAAGFGLYQRLPVPHVFAGSPPPLRVQVHAEGGQCAEAVFTTFTVNDDETKLSALP